MKRSALLVTITLLQLMYSTHMAMAEGPVPEIVPEMPKPELVPARAKQKPPTKKPKKQPTKKAGKAVSRTKEAGPVYIKNPFDLKMTQISVPFYGHDVELIYRAFVDRMTSAKKDEYETTEQYQKRIAKEAATPLLGSLKQDDIFAFVFTPITTYDADTQTFGVIVKPGAVWKQGSSLDNSKVALNLKNNFSSKDTVGQNAYGAKVAMTESYGRDISIAIHNLDSFVTKITYSKFELEQKAREDEMAARYPSLKGAYTSHMTGEKTIEHKLVVGPAEAKRLKDKVAVLVLGMPVPPNVSYGAYLSKATYDYPTESFQQFYYVDVNMQELWIYDNSTGKIIDKIKQKAISVAVPDPADK